MMKPPALIDQASLDHERRDFAVEPSLLFGERSPSPRHAQISPERWLSRCLLRKEPAVVCAVAQDV
jgi:hypothetical protein